MLQHRLVTARFFSCGVWDFGVVASRGSVFWVLSALTLCSKFAGGTALKARFGWDGLEILSTTTTAESTHTNNVAGQLPAFDESLFEWETLTSKNGAPFRVGREKAVAAEPSSRDVYWLADGQWKPTSNDIAEVMGITFVRVTDTIKPGPSRYIFQFYTTKTCNYSFETRTGERYDIPTTKEGLNVVQYDAKDPTIVKLSGN